MSARLGLVGLLLLLAWSAAVPGDSLPDPDLSALDADVRQVLQGARDTRDRQLADAAAPAASRASALATVGRLYQAHLLTGAAIACYARVVELAPDDYRWHYHLAHARDSNGQLPMAVGAKGKV